MNRISSSAIALLMLATVAGPATAFAGEAETKAVFGHHFSALVAGDMVEFMKDYGDNSVVIMDGKVITGTEQIEKYFEGFIKSMTPEFLEAIKMSHQEIVGDVVYLKWTADPFLSYGTDTLVIEDGKIIAQTFAGFTSK